MVFIMLRILKSLMKPFLLEFELTCWTWRNGSGGRGKSSTNALSNNVRQQPKTKETVTTSILIMHALYYVVTREHSRDVVITTAGVEGCERKQ